MKPWLMLLVIAVAAGLGAAAGMGAATVLAALPAMFCLMAAFGGTLHGDLRLLAWFGPVLVLVVGGTKWLAGVAPVLAVPLVTALVFVAGMLPVLGARYVTVGMGLGMAASFAYGFQLTGLVTPMQDFAAPAISVAVVVITRVLLGVTDPDAPLRGALAGVLTGGGITAFEHARAVWQADRPRVWTERAFSGIVRYQNAAQVLRTRRPVLSDSDRQEVDRLLEAAEGEAGRLAAELTAPAAQADRSARVVRRRPVQPLPGATGALVTSVWLGLEAVEAASRDRDRTPVELAGRVDREQLTTAVRGALSWRSVHLRHAVRCAVGMLIAVLVSLAFESNPLRLSFLMAVFAIMQPQLQDTITKAKQRAVGAVAGAAGLALLIVLLDLPNSALVPIGVVALMVGFLFFMQKNPVVFNACIVLMAVGMNVNMRHLELRSTLLQYLGLVALAVVIGLVVGFVAVPWLPRRGLGERFVEAVADMAELLRGVAAGLVTQHPDRRTLRPRFLAAAGSQQNLTASEPGASEPTEAARQAATAASEALRGLLSSATALLMRSRTSAALAGAVAEVARQLEPDVAPAPRLVDERLPAVIDIEHRLLIDTMTTHTRALAEARAVLGSG